MSALPAGRLARWRLPPAAYAQPERRRPHLAALAGYLALTAAVAWPALIRLGSAVAGRPGAVRSAWGLWWWRRALAGGRSPLRTDLLAWPQGADLSARAWDVPSAVAALPLWSAVPPLSPAVPYDLALLASFPLLGLFTYLLCRELWGGWLGPFLAGAIHAFGAWHVAQAWTDLPLASAQWAALYFLGLVRTVRTRGVSGPAVGGLGLGLAALSSPRHLVACAVGTAVLLAAWAWRDRRALLDPHVARRVALLLAIAGLLAGWQVAAWLRAPATAAAGLPDGVDLRALVVPGGVSAWSALLGGAAPSGAAGDGAYLGWVVLALAIAAGARARAARPWLAAAAVAVGALALPYQLARAAPPLARIAPGALVGLAALALAVAAAPSLEDLARRGRRGAALAWALGALALLEAWPRPMPTASWPTPRFLADLARDRERWAVLDASAPDRALWNQLLHRHPQLGGASGAARASPAALRPFLGDGVADLARDAEVRALQDLGVRFVVVEGTRLAQARALELPLAFEGDGLWAFEVPARAPDV